MALRFFCLRALNNSARAVARTQIAGNPLNLFASSRVLTVGENYLIQSGNDPQTRGLQNIRECLPNEGNTATKETTRQETSGTLPDIVQHRVDSELAAESAIKVSKPIVQNKSVEFSAVSDMKVSKRHDLAMVYTCKVCETRSVKTMSRESYEKGIVIVRCGGCNNLHLIADHLGWFGEPSSVEDFLRARGEEIQKGLQDSYEVTLEDLAGWRPK